jgi:hypothetical protein
MKSVRESVLIAELLSHLPLKKRYSGFGRARFSFFSEYVEF